MQINPRAWLSCEGAPTVAGARSRVGGKQLGWEMARRPGEEGIALDLARGLGRRGFRAVLAWQIGRTLFRLVFAGSLAVLAGTMIAGGALDPVALMAATAGLVLATFAGYGAERAAAEAEAGIATGLRATIGTRLSELPAASLRHRSAGDLVVGLARHPDHLGRLVISHGVAARMLSLGPLMAAAAVLPVSWEAALVLLLATPVMIVFFALAGSLIHSRAEAQEKALGRLAAQFADRIRALPTVIANHAVAGEHRKLERRMRAYSDSTMGVLRVAFVNAGIIDFFSSLSIAILAVFLGLGHLGLIELPGFSGLHLWQSLFILMMAPDYFAPFRRYAEQYHAKAEGVAAARELEWLFAPMEDASGGDGKAGDGIAAVRERVAAALRVPLPRTGLVAVSGRSGTGKSTYLRALAGIEEIGAASPPLKSGAPVSWVSSDVYVPSGSLAGAIAWNRPDVPPAELVRAARLAGLLDDPFLPDGLSTRLRESGENLSGGQRMRLAVARAFLADGVVIADEPTAKLDAASAARVRRGLMAAARHRLVVVATHDEELIRLAAGRLDLGADAPAGLREAA